MQTRELASRLRQTAGDRGSVSLWVVIFAFVTLALLILIVAATLESVFGYCLGCKTFGLLMRAGIIPAEVCEACNNIALDASGA